MLLLFHIVKRKKFEEIQLIFVPFADEVKGIKEWKIYGKRYKIHERSN